MANPGLGVVRWRRAPASGWGGPPRCCVEWVDAEQPWGLSQENNRGVSRNTGPFQPANLDLCQRRHVKGLPSHCQEMGDDESLARVTPLTKCKA